MNFLSKLRRAYRLANELRKFDELAADWSADDGIALKTFLVGESGQKLRSILNNFVFKSAIEACQVDHNGDYHRGIARGILLSVHSIDNLLPPAVGAQAANSEEAVE